MDCAIVVVGDELLAGHTADANGPFLATRLRELGHRLVRIAIVPDDEPLIVEALEDAARRAPLVFVCGGLGPTHDDVTIDAVGRFLDVPLETPVEARSQIERVYRKGLELGYLRSADVDEGAWRMARVPRGAVVVPNDNGVAPGSWCATHRAGRPTSVLVLPGPPGELRSVFRHAVEAALVPTEAALATQEVHLATFEAPIARELTEIHRRHPLVKIGSYPQHGEMRVIIRLHGPEGAVEKCVADMHAAFGKIEIPRP